MNPELMKRLQDEFGSNGLDLSAFDVAEGMGPEAMPIGSQLPMGGTMPVTPEVTVDETFSKISVDVSVLGPQEKLDLISMILNGSDMQPIAGEIMTPPIEDVQMPPSLDLPVL